MVSRNVEYTDFSLVSVGFMDLHLCVYGLCVCETLRGLVASKQRFELVNSILRLSSTVCESIISLTSMGIS